MANLFVDIIKGVQGNDAPTDVARGNDDEIPAEEMAAGSNASQSRFALLTDMPRTKMRTKPQTTVPEDEPIKCPFKRPVLDDRPAIIWPIEGANSGANN
ncbi:hypothetical protein SARC_07381 [Sphaeroforma arctica JP610]|uniref:Uncharacterized protein n=1 Tax=Sphaeroforma arctica JP610 TaxID=667725 RepID=A0A0L0FWD0_9EUKA|nr:hypothetical protein SARC_07381 [Sphaeroforma arctica JP610]KNC80258.1 hypothetical protein SARC_07381 [Sphaeroforma arctica JP610]|eukprot:XP_014154160.1 hypothetical protein SARC_07381 [Sphaeroforma arctica JP610]